ncbi:MAG: tetratricopeptide repeat protein [Desulfobacteraceae bacterium]|nr:tetratricopeptide repeat protein [Desulfobacteraceae bacterium]
MKNQSEMYGDIQEMLNSNQDRKAIITLEDLVKQYPDFARAHADLGMLYHKSGDTGKAVDHYKKASELDKGNAELLKILADYYYVELKDTALALITYKKLLDLEPNDVDALTITGNLCLCEHQWDEAEHYYKRVQEIEPWRFEIQEYLDKLATRGEKDENDDHPGVAELYQSSQDQVNAGNLTGALDLLEKIVEIDPERALAYNDLGVIHYQMGKKEKAIDYYRTALKLMPENHVFLKNTADFYCYEQGNLQEALPIYSKILNEEPTDIEVLMTMGRINVHLERPDDAKIFFNRVLDIEPWNIEASEQLELLN